MVLFASCLGGGNIESTKSDLDTVKRICLLKQNFNISNLISEISQFNSTENYDCSKALSAISNGLANLDEWAFKGERNVSESRLEIAI